MEKKLKRDTTDNMVAGVAAGLAKYFELDVTWVRIAFALAAFFGGGGIWVYLILWIAVPEDKISPFSYTDYRVNPDEPFKENFGSTFKPKRNQNMGLLVGLLLIGFGFYFLMNEFDLLPYWFKISKLWPLVFVVIGLSILFKNTHRSPIDGPDLGSGAADQETKTDKSDTDPENNTNL
ncbi:PspC domain-containing protein [Pedobacter sp. SD-b]|uniref:PspC domain-containing protein n=1 Tax=Pedobacter segetis TaxID=2793069 RepID=A0ABS1BH88_9SPHI|nr:PspC domain-containing protein [Pedobacter segetis]MBK0382146.1 PspC domain-containing protein [Pedobacter segetis]